MNARCSMKGPRERRQKVADVDWISNLPDQILIHILSFLNTKEAVQTSFLSKRYRNLWTFVPVLDFDFDDFLPDEVIEEREEDEDYLGEYEEKFVKFVNGVLERREPLNLDSFKLVWNDEDGDSEPTPATTWLDTVAKWKPKFLSVRIFTENYHFEVPDSIFICESLQELILTLGFEDINPVSVNLPHLKRLTLDSVEIAPQVMQKLMSGFPVLEEMVLSYCGLDICEISSRTLKRLILDRYRNDKPPEILISLPSLEYMEIRCWAMGRIKFKKLDSLVKAYIHFQELADEESSFLTGLSNVTALEFVLSDWDLMRMKNVLEKEENFPLFNNLKTLRIGKWCMTRDFDLVARFILHAPNLETVTLLHCESRTGSLREITLRLKYYPFIEINCEKNDESIVRELVKSVQTRLKIVRGTNVISCM